MTIIDTSSFIEAMRPKGRPEVRERVKTLLSEGLACWCDPVRLELWNTRSGDRDRKILNALEAKLPSYPITEDVWQKSTEVARTARELGHTVPSMDLVIFACAFVHKLEIESADHHFETLAKLVDS